MRNDYSAYAADFYINQRLNLKMDLAMRRDTVLSLFDRIRRDQPHMDRFKRYTDELALESRTDGEAVGATQQWVAIRKTSVRSGSVNPETTDEGTRLHKLLLESAPYFLDISPLDVDHLEVLYGFDLMAPGNHDQIVFSALYSGSPIASLLDTLDAKRHHAHRVVECQPLVGVSLSEDANLQAHFEIKTRTNARSRSGEREEPISVYLIIRRYGPFNDVNELGTVFTELTRHGEELLDTAVLPNLVSPIRDAIVTGG